MTNIYSDERLKQFIREVSYTTNLKIDFLDHMGRLVYSAHPSLILESDLVSNKNNEVCGEKSEQDGVLGGEFYGETIKKSNDYHIKSMVQSIYLDNKVEFFIRVIGSSEHIKYTAKIVKRMFTNYFLKFRSVTNSVARGIFLREWLLDRHRIWDEEILHSEGMQYGIDTKAPRCVAALEFVRTHENSLSDFSENAIRAIHEIESSFSYLDNSEVVKDDSLLLLIVKSTGNKGEVQDTITNSLRTIMRRGNPQCYVGLYDIPSSGLDLQLSVKKAKLALGYSLFLLEPENFLQNFSILFWERFMKEISIERKLNIVANVFPNYTDEEIDDTLIILKIFYNFDLNMKRTSDYLHVHVNTLRYRLNKIEELTGVDPRSCEGIARYTVAFNFWLSIYPEKWQVFKAKGCYVDKRYY